MKRAGILSVGLLCFSMYIPTESKAQQNALYSQYMFNPFAINPAYAGSRQSVSGVLLYRNHWVAIDGAPESQTFSIHMPMKGKRVAIGLNVINDKIGPRSNMAAFGTYAYHLPLSMGKLSFGLRAGLYRMQTDESVLDFKDKSDSYNSKYFSGKLIPSFDFGMYYYTKSLYAGAAVTHLSQQKINSIDTEFLSSQLYRHFILTVGYAYPINPEIVLKPSLMTRMMEGTPISMDVNMSALIKKVFWIGLSYRTSKDLVIITEFNITDFLRIGYSYDYGLTEAQSYSHGSHEIFIGVDFDIKTERRVLNPRMF